jgi:hypothetical protein
MDTTTRGAPTVAVVNEQLAHVLACHQNTEAHLALLAQLARHVLTHGTNKWARENAQIIMCFFDGECRLRREIERALYPTLLRGARPRAVATTVGDVVERLITNHADIERAWIDLRAKLYRITNGESDWLRKTHVHRFAQLNARQIYLERTELSLWASKILSR